MSWFSCLWFCFLFFYSTGKLFCYASLWGWLGVVKVSCILCHRGVQLILAYSWARPTILVAGKGRGGMFLFHLLLHFHSCSSFFLVPLFHLHYYLFSGRRHKMTHKGWCVVKPQHNHYASLSIHPSASGVINLLLSFYGRGICVLCTHF